MSDDLVTPMVARIVGNFGGSGPMIQLEVDDPEHESPVRIGWRLRAENHWRCSEHDRMQRADCIHAYWAGVHIADQLLGLTPREDHR